MVLMMEWQTGVLLAMGRNRGNAVANMNDRDRCLYRLGYKDGKRDGAALEKERIAIELLRRVGVKILMYSIGDETFWT